MECLVTYDDIDSSNYVEYTVSTAPTVWVPCAFEQMAVEQLLSTQFDKWLKDVNTTDCQVSLKRLLAAGPPVFISDKMGFPEACNEEKEKDGSAEGKHVEKLWYMSEPDQERSAVLKNALTGEARDKKWMELKILHGFDEEDVEDEDEIKKTEAKE